MVSLKPPVHFNNIDQGADSGVRGTSFKVNPSASLVEGPSIQVTGLSQIKLIQNGSAMDLYNLYGELFGRF